MNFLAWHGRHSLGCSIIIVCVVKMVAQVNGHDAVGDVSLWKQQLWLQIQIKHTKKLTHTQTVIQTCLGQFLCVIGRVCWVKLLACRTKHSAFWLSCHSTCSTKKQTTLTQTPVTLSANHNVCVLRTKMEVQKDVECFQSWKNKGHDQINTTLITIIEEYLKIQIYRDIRSYLSGTVYRGKKTACFTDFPITSYAHISNV